jgi:hypothetical protein
MVVGHDGIDDDFAMMLLAQFLDRRGRAFQLPGGRHQGGAVLQRSP